MGWQGRPHSPMGEDSTNNAKRRRTEAHEARARELAERNTERIHALPKGRRPGATAPTVLKVEALIALWCAGDPEREAQFGAEYQRQLGLALGDLEARVAEEAKAQILRPAETGIVTPIGSRPRHPTGG